LTLLAAKNLTRVKTLAANARSEADALAKRVAALEAALQTQSSAAPAKAKPSK